MKNILTLNNPITINGQECTELTYDAQEITAEQFSLAASRSAAVAKSKTLTLNMRESDYSFHLYLGMMAVLAVNPQIDLSDLERMKGYDTLAMADIGMLFTSRRLEAASGQNSCEKPLENTPEPSTPASGK